MVRQANLDRESVEHLLFDAGDDVSEYDRGAFHSLYTHDHDGLVVELAADTYGVPDDRRGEVFARAHAARLAAGDDYLDAEHREAALEALGLPVAPNDLPDAPTGREF